MSESVQSSAYVVYLCGPSPEGKFYVGQTSNFIRRCLTHQKAGGECPRFHDAVQRFGWETMKAQIVEQTDIAEEADRLERLFITRYNTLFPHGYNMTLGGRWVTFDPDARITNFEEEAVSPAEILEQAQQRLKDRGCPVCGLVDYLPGSTCNRCEVHPSFGKAALEHLAHDLPDNAFLLPLAPKFLRAFRECRDAQLLIDFQKQRLRIRALAAAAPGAASEYYLRLAPYIRTSLKRDVLARKGLASFNLGRWSPLTTRQRSGLGSQIKAERHFRRHKEQFSGTSLERILVIASALSYYGHSEAQLDGVVRSASENGASEAEVAEAKEEAVLIREIERQQATEQQALRPPSVGTEPIIPEEGARTYISVTISDPSPEALAFYRDHLLPSSLTCSIPIEGKPALIVDSGQPSLHYRMLFPDLAARRTEIRRLLTYPPRERRLEVIRTAGPPLPF